MIVEKLTKSQAGALGGKKKWEGVPKKKRTKIMTEIAKLPRKSKPPTPHSD